jgi:Ni/Fe-hydrogenase subunit HybB-like protein
MSRDTASAIDRGLIDGRLARMLAASWPEGAPRTRVLAGAYVSVFFVAAPALAHGTLGRLGAIAHPGLLGPYVALASIVAGTGASVLIATLARDRLADVDELSPASTRVAGNVIAILSALLGAVLFSQLIAGPGPFASLDLGLLPFASRWPAWRGFAMLGLMIGDLAPAVMLATRDARSTPSTVMAAGALAGFGVWAERFALAATARAPGFSWIEVLPGIGFGAWTLLGALVVLRSVGELDDDPSVRESVPAAVR